MQEFGIQKFGGQSLIYSSRTSHVQNIVPTEGVLKMHGPRVQMVACRHKDCAVTLPLRWVQEDRSLPPNVQGWGALSRKQAPSAGVHI